MYDSTRILAVNDLVVFGVKTAKFFTESLESFVSESLFHQTACLVVDGRNVVDAIADSVDIHHAAASKQGVIASLEKLVEQLEYLLFKERCAVVVVKAEGTYEIVPDSLCLFVCGTCGTYLQFPIDLPGVCIDDGNAKVLGDIHA